MDFFYTLLKAFLVGGAFCVVAQLLIDLTKLSPARILVIYVSFGVLLGAVGLYAPLRDFAGCGATVPLIGFGGTAVNYFVYKKLLEKGKAKYAYEIVELAKEISGEE